MTDPKSTTDWTTIIFSVIGTLVAVGLYWLNKRSGRKGLTFEFASTRIASAKSPFRGLQIVFDGEEVSDASVVSVTFRNSGAVPVQRVDFDGDLRFDLGDGVRILAHQLSDTSPKALPVIYERYLDDPFVDAMFAIKPLLLNPGDEFTILALVSGFDKAVSVTGRVAGVKEIVKKVPGQKTNTRSQDLFWTGLSSGMAAAFIYIFLETRANRIFLSRAYYPVMITVMSLTFGMMVLKFRQDR